MKHKNKRNIFLAKILIPYFLITTFIFLFGYDTPMFDEKKLFEFLPPFIFLLIVIIYFTFLKFDKNTCRHCGLKIRNLNEDCYIGKVKYLKTIEKTNYKTLKTTTVKGTTVHTRGGYAPRNSVLEPISESNYEIKEQIPITKQYYLYKIEYRCKNCHQIYKYIKEERTTPLNNE